MKRATSIRVLSLVLFAACSVAGWPQEVLHSRPEAGAGAGEERLGVQPSAAGVEAEEVGENPVLTDTPVAGTARRASRPLPPLSRGDIAVACFPACHHGGYSGLRELHEGFNAGLDMSVSASFGKDRFPGVGFGTGLSVMYVRGLADRLVLAAGGFYDRLSWNGLDENRFGVSLLAGCQLTGRVGLYAYGSKSFSPMRGRRPWIPPMPWMDDFSSRWGGMVRFKVSDATSVSLSVERTGWGR